MPTGKPVCDRKAEHKNSKSYYVGMSTVFVHRVIARLSNSNRRMIAFAAEGVCIFVPKLFYARLVRRTFERIDHTSRKKVT